MHVSRLLLQANQSGAMFKARVKTHKAIQQVRQLACALHACCCCKSFRKVAGNTTNMAAHKMLGLHTK